MIDISMIIFTRRRFTKRRMVSLDIIDTDKFIKGLGDDKQMKEIKYDHLMELEQEQTK